MSRVKYQNRFVLAFVMIASLERFRDFDWRTSTARTGAHFREAIERQRLLDSGRFWLEHGHHRRNERRVRGGCETNR